MEKQPTIVSPGLSSPALTEEGVAGTASNYRYAEITSEEQKQYGKTRRGLSRRHMQLITIGSSIGTGIFVGVGSALARSGPLSVFLAFTVYSCLVLWPLMMCAAELCTWLPMRGSIFLFAERYVDPALGFAAGYIYWYEFETFARLRC